MQHRVQSGQYSSCVGRYFSSLVLRTILPMQRNRSEIIHCDDICSEKNVSWLDQAFSSAQGPPFRCEPFPHSRKVHSKLRLAVVKSIGIKTTLKAWVPWLTRLWTWQGTSRVVQLEPGHQSKPVLQTPRSPTTVHRPQFTLHTSQ